MEWEFRTRVGFSRQVTGSVKKYDAADLIAPILMCPMIELSPKGKLSH